MLRFITFCFAIAVLFFAVAGSAYARDEAAEAVPQSENASESVDGSEAESEGDAVAEVEGAGEAEEVEEKAPELPPLRKPSKALTKLNQDVAKITRELDDYSRSHFYMMYNNHNLISTVKRVKQDVGNAVEACGEANSDMEKPLQERFAQWSEAVDEKLDAANAHVDNMIIAQDYTSEKTIRSVMKQADDLRDETMLQTERIPVTTKEACEYLLNKMDETQANLVSLLESTLITLPQALESSRSGGARHEDEGDDAEDVTSEDAAANNAPEQSEQPEKEEADTDIDADAADEAAQDRDQDAAGEDEASDKEQDE